ncbi:unnamed protein product [Rhizophagus irregularis]|nr:unnamed protein product [Rhizophagus irregularis]
MFMKRILLSEWKMYPGYGTPSTIKLTESEIQNATNIKMIKCQHSLSLSVPAAAAAPISYDRSPIPGQMPPAMPPDMAPRQTMKMYQDKAIIK